MIKQNTKSTFLKVWNFEYILKIKKKNNSKLKTYTWIYLKLICFYLIFYPWIFFFFFDDTIVHRIFFVFLLIKCYFFEGYLFQKILIYNFLRHNFECFTFIQFSLVFFYFWLIFKYVFNIPEQYYRSINQ